MKEEKDWVRVSSLRAACALHSGELNNGVPYSIVVRHVLETAEKFEKYLTKSRD